MSSLFSLGQLLRGKNHTYTITKHLQDCIWLAKCQTGTPVIVKSVRHFRINNERDVLQRFQDHTPFLRPLLDEIVEPNDTPAIVLKYLEDHLLHASVSERLSKDEIKYVSKGVLQALNVLHQEGFVHTDVKPDNVLVNYGPENNGVRFTDVQLADCGSTVPATSEYAKDGYMIGAPIWRSPEAQLGIGWCTSTDIWSFGTMPGSGHKDYEMRIVERQCQYFGPFPIAYQEIAPSATLNVLMGIMRGLKGKQRPFTHISEKELSKKDKEFILRIMKLDPRERPSAQDLLNDEWFST